jgi:predicted O-methyltransferase YrrM
MRRARAKISRMLWRRLFGRRPPPAGEPLMIAPRTQNTRHPGYDAHAARNYPGRVMGPWPAAAHPILTEIVALGRDGHVPADRWRPTIAAMRAEVEHDPDGARLFAERRTVEAQLAALSRMHGAQYNPGWVNVDDGLFLYWLVRRLRPRTIVQTGVCNGLSSALIALALVRNGDGGQLHAIDLPRVFDRSDAAWTRRGEVYGVVIPEGRSSGWLVPASCRDRVHIQLGDAAGLLEPLLTSLGEIDLFFHDSDHTYDHMALEFREARKVLRPGGLVVADDIAWNASLWDAADQWGVPAYNFAGSMGVAFV